MEQAAEFVGAGGQTTEADATDRRCVVGHDGHRELATRAVPSFVAQLPCPPPQPAGNEAFDHRAAGARRAGQRHVAGGTFAGQVRGSAQVVDSRRGWRRRAGLDRAGDAHGENAASRQGLPPREVVQGKSAGPRVEGRGRPRGAPRQGRLDLVDQGQAIAGSTGVTPWQLHGEEEAGGGRGKNPRLAAKLGGQVLVPWPSGALAAA
jgi:hypothetical protein